MMYLLLVAPHHWEPLALAFINLKAYNWLPRVALWRILAEKLKVLADIQTSIKAIYYQKWSVVEGGVVFVCCL